MNTQAFPSEIREIIRGVSLSQHIQDAKKFSVVLVFLCSLTADVRQPWTNPHDLYFQYLIIRFDYSIIG